MLNMKQQLQPICSVRRLEAGSQLAWLCLWIKNIIFLLLHFIKTKHVQHCLEVHCFICLHTELFPLVSRLNAKLS